MQTLSSIIKYILESNIINFIIMCYILYFICKKFDIKTHFITSIEKVKSVIDNSEQEKFHSQQNLEKSIEKLEELPQKITEMKNASKQKSELFIQQSKHDLQINIDNINQNSKKTLSIEEKKISNEILSNTVKVSIDNSRQKILNQLKSNPDLHLQFIQQSLSELEKANIS